MDEPQIEGGALPEDVRALVEQIHETAPLAVIAVSGAGSQALAWLLGVGGASRTLLEATVPYAQRSTIEYLGFEPSEYASAEAAIGLAEGAHRRALHLGKGHEHPLLGLGCAATIATDRLKRGEHRAYVAVEGGARGARCVGLVLDKGARDRAGEEALVSRILLNALAEASGLDGALALALRPGERIEVSERSA